MTVYVILGYTLHKNDIHPILKKRIDVFLKKCKKGDKVILSGGKSNSSQKHTQAFIMKKYIKNHTDIEDKNILLENKSKTTVDNIFFTFKLLEKHNISNVSIITSTWHLKRVKMIVKYFSERKMKITYLGARKLRPNNPREEKLIHMEKKYMEDFKLFSQKYSQ